MPRCRSATAVSWNAFWPRAPTPAIKDARFEATALGWARHFEHSDLVAVLERITPEDSA